MVLDGMATNGVPNHPGVLKNKVESPGGTTIAATSTGSGHVAPGERRARYAPEVGASSSTSSRSVIERRKVGGAARDGA